MSLQNLKFLGLVAMEKLSQSHPEHVQKHTDIILSCLSDVDITIKMQVFVVVELCDHTENSCVNYVLPHLQALKLLDGIVSKTNLVSVCNQLAENLVHATREYRDALCQKIIFLSSRRRYADVQDFGWYEKLCNFASMKENLFIFAMIER